MHVLHPTWVLTHNDRLLLHNVSHVSIERPLWGAAGFGGQAFNRVPVCSMGDSGSPKTQILVYRAQLVWDRKGKCAVTTPHDYSVKQSQCN